MSDPNQIFQVRGSQHHPGCFLLPRPNTFPQVVFAFEVAGCDAFMPEERVRDCIDKICEEFKDIQWLDFKTSWNVQQPNQDEPQV